MMNSFGLNSAALNAGVTKYVLGAALLAATGSFAATPTRTTTADPVVVSMASKLDAKGVRNVLGAASSDASFTAFSDGTIAITASATSTARGTLSANYTEAYSHSAFQASAEGTIIRPGAAIVLASMSASAEPLRYAYMTATGAATFTARADASVKRAGQSTTERDGYAMPMSGAFQIQAAALRTALPTAFGDTLSGFEVADSTKIHGGRATLASSFDLVAIPAIDGCYSPFIATFSAEPLHTHMAAAQMEGVGSFSAFAERVTTVPMLPAIATSDFTADGRLAQRGAAHFAGESRFSAVARLAELGAATCVAQFTTDAAPWIYRPASARLPMSSDFTAIGRRIYMGAATGEIRFRASALAIVNPTVPAPATRTMRVAAQNRAMRVPAQSRSMRVPA